MPTVLREGGFAFVIYVDDHTPMHVHVKKGGAEVVIELGDANTKPSERENKGMRWQERRKALLLAAEHQDELIERWREIHGDA
jgi:hypothetical protein